MAKVGIVMGSDSDMPVMAKAADILDKLGIDYEMTIISAHREPDVFFEYAKSAEAKGFKVIIAGAGMAAYQQAVQALKNKQFVLEANQVIFRNGMSAFVTSNTNFVLMNGNRATVQTAFNTPYPGPNGIGGVTVDGNSSDMKMNVDKKGNVNCSFSVQGIGISAQVFITMSNGDNNASVTISPNFSNNNLTLNGNIIPLDQSNIFKGRSW